MKTSNENKNSNFKLRVRNLFWNKHIHDLEYNFELSERLNNILKSFKFITYSIFTPEKCKEGFHFQGYLEFNDTIRIEVFDKKIAEIWDETDSFFHGKERRKSFFSQQAIDYVKKEGSFSERKEEQLDRFFEFGNRKMDIYSYDLKNKKLPKDKISQETDIIKKIQSGNYYKKFEDIENEYIHIYNKQKNWLKNVWNENNPINQLNVKQAQVIYLFGESEVGKSTETKKIIRNLNYKKIATISPQNMTYSDKVYFDISFENCEVLIINEVDDNFPKHNNLISFIDRNTLLVTKGSHIRNNFKLIIINSVYRPEKVFSYLGRKVATQIIRRIYSKVFDCHVYHLFQNKKQIKDLLENKRVFSSDIEFQDWYKPIIKEIKEPDYSLIPEFNIEEIEESNSIKNKIKIKKEIKETNKKSFFQKLKDLFK